jgi:dipeptidyl aminopeptidase/acylaminoacyl peptidase
MRAMRSEWAVLATMLVSAVSLSGQAPVAADERAAAHGAARAAARERVERWQRLARPELPDWHWLDGGAALWFVDPAGGPLPVVLVGADGTLRRGASREALGLGEQTTKLPPQARWRASAASTRATSITFRNRHDRPVRLFWVDGEGLPRSYGELAAGAERSQATFVGHVWLADFAADDLAGVFVAAPSPGLATFDAESQTAAMARAATSPARLQAEVTIREHDVVAVRADGSEVRLTTDGCADDPYEPPTHWSPAGDKVLGFQVERGEDRLVHLIESAPKDQLQPKLHTLHYRKPGDRIERPRPRLFDLAGCRCVPIDDAAFGDAWSIDHVTWAPDGREVRLLYNRRGHQLQQLLAIDAASGAIRQLVEERRDTFVDYSQKTFLHWFADGERFLWASERDGWNHLYLGDARTGACRQLTKGPWLVRAVEHVDEVAGEVWFTALGLHAGQDPYHAHLARAALADGTVTPITAADGTHHWTFAPDRSRVVVCWSRVDHPWVAELRDARSGALVAELARAEVAPLLAAGFRPPQRFVAKGRDGTTDIHGILILPSAFDATRRYPVLEDIYAGPHDHFVPKAWGLGRRQRLLAELGFVVVQIDGMGTNWRHQAFHAVCWRNLRDSGLPDRIGWLRAAAAAMPWLDLERVGIFGGSAGGQSALAALLHHGDFYRAAVADCGCHDNRMDKIWWNEAWMGWPVGPWYADNSNVTHAAKLRGALLLTVGELDRNVDPASTMQVVAALQQADRDFELVVVPGAGHGVGESAPLVRRRQQFFQTHLRPGEPR